MNEFIVWDKRINSINNDLMIDKNGHVFGLSGLDNDVTYLNREDYSIHRSIKKDINDKKIYVDCSIVEFEIIDESGTTKLYGFFTFNDSESRYEIDILQGQMPYVCLSYNNERMLNFKIIDTIQENKLGLIK